MYICVYERDTEPESLSVRVKVKDVASRKAVRFGPTLLQPSGWQKYTISRGRGKSLWSSTGYLRSNSGTYRKEMRLLYIIFSF